MINYLQKPVRMSGPIPGESYVGKLKQVRSPIIQVDFTPGGPWKAGHQISCVIEHEQEPMKVEGVVLANEPSGTSVWVTFSSIRADSDLGEVYDPGLVYVTVTHQGVEHRALARQVATEVLRVDLSARLPVGAEVTATVHIGMMPIVIPCRVTCCLQPMGSAHVLTCLEVTRPSGMTRARWQQYVEGLAMAAA